MKQLVLEKCAGVLRISQWHISRKRSSGKEDTYLDNKTLPVDLCKERTTSNLDREFFTVFSGGSVIQKKILKSFQTKIIYLFL